MLKPLTLIIALTVTPLTAETDTCKLLGDVAETAMDRRQEGVSLSTLMGVIDGDLVKSIIILAYEQPRYSSPEYQRRASEDFRNDVEAACYGANQ